MSEHGGKLIEECVKDLEYLEQYVAQVLDYSSKYNSRSSRFYAPENLIGKYEVYPAYGDFVSTYSLRHYGKWWKNSKLYHSDYMPQDIDPLGAEDYVTVLFRSAVVPRDIFIYETYNPGAVVRIWGRLTDHSWMLLWEAASPELCPQEARKFAPKIRKINKVVDQLRLELNQSHLQYYTALDAILLGGLKPASILKYNLLLNNFLLLNVNEEDPVTREEVESPEGARGVDPFSKLPDLVLIHIFGYLDLKSLCRCAQVNRQFYYASLATELYYNLSLKRYWHKVNTNTLKYFKNRFRHLKKLDLSWCSKNGDETFHKEFIEWISQCRNTLTHIALNNCDFINQDVISALSECKGLTELRLENCQISHDWLCLLVSPWNKLVTLDLSGCDIKNPVIMNLLRSNPGLKHINLDFCENLSMDTIANVATENCPLLESWSSWKTHSWTATGVLHFARCYNLVELNLGWCLMLPHPEESLTKVSEYCPNLERLNISGWRAADDQVLFPVINACKNLKYLELVGLKSVTQQLCEIALNTLPNLELIDVSFCDVSRQDVTEWKRMFPHVTVQRTLSGDCESGVI